MTQKTYVNYVCNTCKRELQYAQDKNRIDLYRCIITYKCSGILSRIGVSNRRNDDLLIGENGINDYIKRGTIINLSNTPAILNKINITSGLNNILTSAGIKKTFSNNIEYFYVNDISNQKVLLQRVDNINSIPNKSKIIFRFNEITKQSLTSTTYIFNKSLGVQFIQGRDDSRTGKLLTFNKAVNNVNILLNGVTLDPSKYDITTNNIIKFTPILTDSKNKIEINVSLKISENASTVDLLFKTKSVDIAEELSTLNTTSWGDCIQLSINNRPNTEYLLYCENLSILNKNKSYLLQSVIAVDENNNQFIINSSEISLLLGYSPYTFNDKNLNTILIVNDLIIKNTIITYSGTIDLDESVFTNYFNNIKIIRKNSSNLLNNSQTVGSLSTLKTNKYILGVF